MNIIFEDFVERHKQAVIKMIEERAALPHDDPTAGASDIWTPLAGTFRYLLDLSPENLRNIRYHSTLLSGHIEGHGVWGDSTPDEYTDEEAQIIGFPQATEGVPEKYWLSEPASARVFGPLGRKYRGRTISPILVKFQRTVSNLYHVGALQSLETASERQIIVEVGGGFGGLAQGLGQILKSKVTYIIIDLPEVLFISGVYLAHNNPEQSIYVYDRDTFTPEFVSQGIREYDVVLVPNFALTKLEPIDSIALMINTISFQEMTDAQVEGYVKFGASRITGYLYSVNIDREIMNTQLGSVSTILAKYLDLYPELSYYRGRRWEQGQRQSRHYFGVPKGFGRTIPKTTIVGITDKQVKRGLLLTIKRLTNPLIPRRVRQLLRAALDDQ